MGQIGQAIDGELRVLAAKTGSPEPRDVEPDDGAILANDAVPETRVGFPRPVSAPESQRRSKFEQSRELEPRTQPLLLPKCGPDKRRQHEDEDEGEGEGEGQYSSATRIHHGYRDPSSTLATKNNMCFPRTVTLMLISCSVVFLFLSLELPSEPSSSLYKNEGGEEAYLDFDKLFLVFFFFFI